MVKKRLLYSEGKKETRYPGKIYLISQKCSVISTYTWILYYVPSIYYEGGSINGRKNFERDYEGVQNQQKERRGNVKGLFVLWMLI